MVRPSHGDTVLSNVRMCDFTELRKYMSGIIEIGKAKCTESPSPGGPEGISSKNFLAQNPYKLVLLSLILLSFFS